MVRKSADNQEVAFTPFEDESFDEAMCWGGFKVGLEILSEREEINLSVNEIMLSFGIQDGKAVEHQDNDYEMFLEVAGKFRDTLYKEVDKQVFEENEIQKTIEWDEDAFFKNFELEKLWFEIKYLFANGRMFGSGNKKIKEGFFSLRLVVDRAVEEFEIFMERDDVLDFQVKRFIDINHTLRGISRALTNLVASRDRQDKLHRFS